MSFYKKSSLIGTFLLFTVIFNAYSMKRLWNQSEPSVLPSLSVDQGLFKGEWEEQIAKILIGIEPVKILLQKPQSSESFHFYQLPQDIRNIIIDLLSVYTVAKTLNEASFMINSIARVNKELNELINKPVFNEKLVKYLADKFKVDAIIVCMKLQTKEANRLLASQLINAYEYNDFGLMAACLNTAISVEDAAAMVESLDRANSELHQLMNNYMFFRHIVNYLSIKFKCSALEVCEKIYIQEKDHFLIDLVLEAARNGDTKLIHDMQKAKININISNEQGMTALMVAMDAQKKKLLRMLVLEYKRLKIDPNQQNINGETALMIGVKNNFLVGVQELLNACFGTLNLGITNNNGQTALMIAQAHGKGKMIADFIDDAKRFNDINEQKGRMYALKDLLERELQEQQHQIEFYQLHQIFSTDTSKGIVSMIANQLQEQMKLLKGDFFGRQKLSLQELLQLQQQLLEQRKLLYQLESINNKNI